VITAVAGKKPDLLPRQRDEPVLSAMSGKDILSLHSCPFACPVEWAQRDQPGGHSTGVLILWY